MSATRDLIAAALTAADELDELHKEGRNPATFTPSMVREACARAMVQPAAPDMVEVERLLEAYDHEYASGGSVEDYDRARAALLDYVRQGFAAALQPVSAAEVPMPIPTEYQGAKVGTEWGGEAYSAGYFDGESAGYARGLKEATGNADVECSTCHYAAPTRHEQCSGCEQNVTMFINYKRASWAALRGEVKP